MADGNEIRDSLPQCLLTVVAFNVCHYNLSLSCYEKPPVFQLNLCAAFNIKNPTPVKLYWSRIFDIKTIELNIQSTFLFLHPQVDRAWRNLPRNLLSWHWF